MLIWQVELRHFGPESNLIELFLLFVELSRSWVGLDRLLKFLDLGHHLCGFGGLEIVSSHWG